MNPMHHLQDNLTVDQKLPPVDPQFEDWKTVTPLNCEPHLVYSCIGKLRFSSLQIKDRQNFAVLLIPKSDIRSHAAIRTVSDKVSCDEALLNILISDPW